MASTLLTGGFPFVVVGFAAGLVEAAAALTGGFAGAALPAVGLWAGFGGGFLAGAVCLVFDFAADFVAITILCAAGRATDSQKGGANVAPPERIKGRQSQTGPIKPRLTLTQPTKLRDPSRRQERRRKKSPYPMYGVSGHPVRSSLSIIVPKAASTPGISSKRPHPPTRRGTKPVDQGFRAFERPKARLNVAQPSEVLLTRLGSQGQLGVFELLM
jgi:hypothetical protein